MTEKRIKKIMSEMTEAERCIRLVGEVSKRHYDRVRILLNLGTDVNYKDINGWSVLHTAACNGDTEMVELLLKFGADPNNRDVSDWNPLYMAVRGEFTDVISILLEAGSRADMQDCDGWTLLHAAAYNGDTDTMKKLIEFGGNPMSTNRTGTSAMETLKNLYPDKYEAEFKAITDLYIKTSSLSREDSSNNNETPVDFNI